MSAFDHRNGKVAVSLGGACGVGRKFLDHLNGPRQAVAPQEVSHPLKSFCL